MRTVVWHQDKFQVDLKIDCSKKETVELLNKNITVHVILGH